MALNQLGLGLLFTAKDAASGVMKNVRNGFSQTRDELGQFGQRSKQTFKEFGVGMAVMGAGLAGLAILGSTIDDAREFGKAIDLVRTEVKEATFSQQDMKDITIDLGKQFGRMPTDEAAALYKAVALGANTATKATAIMTSANQLAVAGNSDLSTTMDALGGAINAYGLTAADAGRVSDAFFNAMRGGNTTVQALASSVGRVSAGAHAMGISVEEVLGSVSVMTNKGIQASEAVSYLHGALANITHPSAKAAAEAARLGIKFNASAVRAQGFSQFLHSITDNAKFGAKSLETLFESVEGGQAMAMLAGDMGAVDAQLKAMKDGAGATKGGFDIMSQGLDFQTQKLKANFSALKIRIGEFLEPLAAGGARILNRVMDWFTSLPGPVQKSIVSIAAAAAGIVTLVGGFAMGIATVKILTAALLTFGGGALGTVVAALAPAIAGLGLLYGAFKLIQKAYDENIAGFGDWFDRIYGQAKLGIDAITQLFTQGGFSGAVREEFLKGSNPVINFAIQVYLAFNRIENFIENLIDGFMSFANEMGPTFDGLRAAVDKLLDSFGVLSLETNDAGTAFDDAGAAGRKTGIFLAKLVEIAIQGITAFINFTAEIIPFIKSVSSAADSLGGFKGILLLARDALIAYTAFQTGSAIVGVVEFGIQNAAAAVKVVAFAQSLSIQGAVNGFRAAMTAMGASSAAALIPIAATAAAIASLMVAFDQYQKLAKELEGSKDQFGKSHAWHDFSTKLRFDLGIDNQAEYEKRLGVVTGGDWDAQQSFQARQRQLDAAAISPSPVVSASTSPAIASIQPAASFDAGQTEAAASAAASAAVSKVPPPNYTFIMQTDEGVLGRVTAKAQNASGALNYSPSSVAE